MTGAEAALLVVGATVAGVVNTLAGGASALTVPLLVLVGLPGTLANGTNRVGILTQNVVAAWRFRAEGVSGFRAAVPAFFDESKVRRVSIEVVGAADRHRFRPASIEDIKKAGEGYWERPAPATAGEPGAM